MSLADDAEAWTTTPQMIDLAGKMSHQIDQAPITAEAAREAIRAAYAFGYTDALQEARPLTHEVALARAEALRLRLPV